MTGPTHARKPPGTALVDGCVRFPVRGTLRLRVGAHADHVMLGRIGAANRPHARTHALEHPGAEPAVMRGRPMRWLFLERPAVEPEEQLAHRVALALAAMP